ncbi:hypothetical protein [Mycobacterium sp.]|uniref:hypothetical protein n=1 Tax=Mycobacterium sp. TaxID=1785 RepID=UPI003A852A8F
MSRHLWITLTAGVAVAVAGLLGCSRGSDSESDSAGDSLPPPTPAATAETPLTTVSTVATATVPPATELPAPEALTGVLARLADPAVPGGEKLDLVDGSGPDTAGALDRFIAAARDSGYLPMAFEANDIARSSTDPSNVAATVVVTTANEDHREFTFPMEFTAAGDGWQLSRKTADMLLAMQSSGTVPPASPEPAPPSNPAPPAEPGLPAEPGPPAGPSPPG